MAIIEMTDQEKALLDLAYTDGERILEGKLFDYQEKALAELRAGMAYLKERYPNEELEVISFQPSSKKGCVELQFIQPGLDEVEYLLKNENGTYIDNFYDVPYEKEYDGLVEEILKEGGITARAYTTFPFLISDEIKSGKDLMDRRPHLGRTAELFINAEHLPSYEDAGALSKKVQELFEESGIYGSGMIFFITGLKSFDKMDVLQLDAYARNRKNLRNIVSVTFQCFQVKK